MAAKKKRVRVEISFEIERDVLPPRSQLEAAFNGAANGVLAGGEPYFNGHTGARIVGAGFRMRK